VRVNQFCNAAFTTETCRPDTSCIHLYPFVSPVALWFHDLQKSHEKRFSIEYSAFHCATEITIFDNKTVIPCIIVKRMCMTNYVLTSKLGKVYMYEELCLCPVCHGSRQIHSSATLTPYA